MPNIRLRKIYLAYGFSFVIMLALIVGTPFIVTSGISIFEEETVELVVLSTLTLSGAFLLWNYAKFTKRQSESYDEIIRHVGALNLQVEQIEKVIRSSMTLPSTPDDIRKMFSIMGNVILSVVDVDWVFVRALNVTALRTLTEKGMARGEKETSFSNISNKELARGESSRNHKIFSYDCGNDISLFLIMPSRDLTEAQTTIIQTATTNAGMMFRIFHAEKRQAAGFLRMIRPEVGPGHVSETD